MVGPRHARHDALVAGRRGHEHRDMTLMRRLSELVQACALHRPVLFCTDGLCFYIALCKRGVNHG